MAPEQVHSGVEPISPATDIYALGIVLYELVTDEMPFKGNSTTVMALKRIKEKPRVAARVRPRSGRALGSHDHALPRTFARARASRPPRRCRRR